MHRMDLLAEIKHEDEMLWAEVVELPGCFASGRDVRELTEALQEAIGLYLDVRPSRPLHLTSIGFSVDELHPA